MTETQVMNQTDALSPHLSIAGPLPPGAAVDTALPKPPATTTARRLTMEPAFLLTVDATGEIALPGIGVQLDNVGLSVLKDDGVLVAVLPWGDLSDLSVADRTVTPDGSQAVVVEATTRLRTHRFVVPSDDPSGLEAAVTEFSDTRHASGRGRRISKLLGGLFVLLAAALVVVVLAAMGTIKL